MDTIKKELLNVIQSVSPVSIVVLFFLSFISKSEIPRFIVGSIMVIIGITLFLLGINLGFLPFGEAIGSELPMKTSLVFIAILTFVIGVIATIAEPGVRVLINRVDYVSGSSIPQAILFLSIGVGMGFLSLAVLRIIYGINYAYLFTIGYIFIISLSFLTSPSFVAVAFDAGELQLISYSANNFIYRDRGKFSAGWKISTFGWIWTCRASSMGPIISIMVLGVLYA